MLEHLILCLIIVIGKRPPPERLLLSKAQCSVACHYRDKLSSGPRYENSNDKMKSVDRKNEHSELACMMK